MYSPKQRLLYGNALVWNPTRTTTSEDPRKDLAPHVYEVSCLAYKGLLQQHHNQSILVSGESGAGKTETVKILLGDLASVQNGASGGTKNTVVQSLVETSSSSSSTIVQKVLDTNPLLEAFGNAQTLRNDNSSRFGKYLQLQFDWQSPSSCPLAGSTAQVYLLEKSRVTLHHIEERTYHIFYQLLAAPEAIKAEIWKGLEDTDNESFSYVGYTSTTTIEGVSDAERFQQTTQALELIGVTGETLKELWRALCIVLQLGNLEFAVDATNPDASCIADPEELEVLADLMGIESTLLIKALTIRTVEARSETFQVPLKADKAKESTDAFAKEIYAKTFLWLVRTINDATCAEKNYGMAAFSSSGGGGGTATTSSSSSSFSLADSIRARSATTTATKPKTMTTTLRRTSMPTEFGIIGLLDIFGFETFEINRFEQLCINYCNEKLQQKFTQDIFRSVQLEYQLEGIALEEITYDDNTHVLDLVEGRMGLLAFLNEECMRPQGSDKTFVYKAQSCNQDNRSFVRAKHASDHEFGIRHYAGLVMYDATNFVVKNMDTLPSDLQDCAAHSSNMIVGRELNNEASMNLPLDRPTGGAKVGTGLTKKKKRPKNAPAQQQWQATYQKKRASSNISAETVWTKFKNQLTNLMETLSQTQTRYIRCIKPNAQKKPLLMEHKSTVEQLRCAGVVAAVTISRSAFPNRLEHVVVLERFQSLWPKGDHVSILKDTTLDMMERQSKATDVLLTIALKDMEIDRPDGGGKIRAFVMGRTRAYFRAGALEFLESERIRQLGTFASIVQTQVRGWVQRSKYRGFLQSTIRLQSGYRRHVAQASYQSHRSSSIRIQCWYRVLFAARTIVHLRRALKATMIQTQFRIRRDSTRYRQMKAAAIVLQTIMRGAIQRPKYRQALQSKKDEAKLENQLVALQRKLEEAEARREQAEKAAEAKAQAALEEQERQKQEAERQAKLLEESKIQEDTERLKAAQEAKAKDEEAQRIAREEAEKAAALEREIQLQEEQQKLMDESGRMLEYLRKEVFKLRTHNQQLQTDFDLLKENNQRLMDANASAGASFAALNQHAKQMTKQNGQLMKDIEMLKAQNQKMSILQVELKDELKMKQGSYIAEVQSRLQYQKSFQKVTDMIQEKCRDHKLVEKVLQVADECDMEYMPMDAHHDRTNATPHEDDDEDDEDGDRFPDGDPNSSRGLLGFFFG